MPEFESSTGGTRSRATIEVLHHFVGDDSVAMEELVELVERDLPNVNVDEIGDPQVSMRAKTDILRGNPPDLWDDWPGKNLLPYWEAEVLADISDVWDDAGFTRTFFDSASEAATIDGAYYALPMNIQRQNNLFYNTAVLREADVDPDRIRDPDALVRAMEQVEAATDSAGLLLPQKRPWPSFDLWDDLLVGLGDADTYDQIFRGDGAARYRDVVRDAFEYVDRYHEFAPDDATYDSWQPALARFAEGEAAFYVMGDWAAGVLDNRDDFRYGDDWGSVAFPGTDDVYQVVMDSFLVPTLTDAPEVARAVVKLFGSQQALERFTSIRGALPPRRDVSMDGHSTFFQEQMDSYRRASAEVLSTRGNGIRPQERVELITAMASFISGEYDATEATATVVDALME